MTHDARTDHVSSWHRKLLVAATAMTALLIFMGGVVCVTQSGRACPDWPRCNGQLGPPMRLDAIIEYSHRLVAALTSPFILAAAVVGWMRTRSLRWVSWPPTAALVLLLGVVVFGAIAVLRGLPPWAAAVDLGAALIVLALLVMSSVAAVSGRAGVSRGARIDPSGSFTKWSVWTAAITFAVLASGVLTADNGSILRCLGCVAVGGATASGARGAVQFGREFAAAGAGVLIAALVVRVRPACPSHPAIRRAATAAAVLLLVQVGLAAAMMPLGLATPLLVAAVATAVGLWIALISLVTLSIIG